MICYNAGMETQTRVCSKCKKEKQIDEFYPLKTKKHTRQGYCRQCHRNEVKEWRRNHVEYCRARNFKRNYGITMDEYNVRLASQNGVCAICGNGETRTFRGMTRVLSIDHDHETNIIRGLLCCNCNAMIGYAKDDISVLESAIAYLKSHS